MHQRLPAGEDNPSHVQRAEAGEMRFDIFVRDLSNLTDFPDVTHHAAAVASVVRKEHKNRQLLDAVLRCGHHAETLIPANCISEPTNGVVSYISRSTGARTQSRTPSTSIDSSPSVSDAGNRSRSLLEARCTRPATMTMWICDK